MIVWSEKEGHRRQRLAFASSRIRRIEFEEVGRTAPTRTDKVQITKAFTTLNEGTSPVNPHVSAPLA